MASATAIWNLEESPDPKVPVCRARTPQEILLFRQRAKAFILGLGSMPEDHFSCGPRLLLNVREAVAEAFLGQDPGDFKNDNDDKHEDGTTDAGGSGNRRGNG